MARKKNSPNPNRKPIPAGVRQIVLMEAGYKCANPNCRHILTLELHHIVWVKDGGGNNPDNLVALCPNCHSLHTAGHIAADAIRCWKSLLVSLSNPNRVSADLLLVLYDEEKRVANSSDQNTPLPFRFSGDGLGVLASLLTSSLIEISKRFSGVQIYGGGNPSFEVRLTARGKQLVEAWRSGNQNAVSRVIHGELKVTLGSVTLKAEGIVQHPNSSVAAPDCEVSQDE